MVEDSDVKTYRPPCVIDQEAVKQSLDTPLPADASRRNQAAPVVLSALAAPGLVSPVTQAPSQAD